VLSSIAWVGQSPYDGSWRKLAPRQRWQPWGVRSVALEVSPATPSKERSPRHLSQLGNMLSGGLGGSSRGLKTVGSALPTSAARTMKSRTQRSSTMMARPSRG